MSETKEIAYSSPPASIQAKRQLEDAQRFLATGKFSEAQDASRDLLGAHPEYVEALSTLGQSYLAEQNYDSALPCFVRATMLSADDPAILIRLAEVYFHLGSYDLSRKTAERALELAPDGDVRDTAHLLLGRVCRGQEDLDAAIEHLSKASADAGVSKDAKLLLGKSLLAANDREHARAALSAALKEGMAALDHAQALYALSQISDAPQAKKLLSELEALEDEAQEFGSEDDEQKFAGYREITRGLLLGRAGRHEEAWQVLDAANAQLGQEYSEAQRQLREVDEQAIQRASAWNYAGPPMTELKGSAPVSLFILGPPCSGVSSVEKLLGVLKGVTKGYAHRLVQTAACETATSNGLLPLSYPGQLPASMHRQITEVYAREAASRAGDAKVLTCTNAELVPDLGRIVESVPKTKVIFVERDSDDTALRIYEKYYADGRNPFAYDVGAIYEHLETFARFADAWSGSLGDVCIRVSYEDVAADPKVVLKSIAGFLGLDAARAKVPDIGDDRGCAKPYLEFLERARSVELAPLSGWAVPEL